LVISTAVPAAATNAFEWNTASGNSDWSGFTCAHVTASQTGPGYGCFAASGDVFQVHDQTGDHHSIALYWQNWVDGAKYRHGACVESRGAGSVGDCNKNFIEGSGIYIQACTFESATKTKLDCGEWAHTYA
jgi:hypothetical protein